MTYCKDNVNNEIAYFYKVIKNMNTKEKIEQNRIQNYELPLDKILCDSFYVEDDIEKRLSDKNLLDWIDFVENQKLHKALKNLPIEDQVLLSYIMKECRTQKELSCHYNTTQQNLSKKLSKILLNLKKFLK